MSNSSNEKTERATPKKRRDARQNGQVLRSQEISTAAQLLLMFITLRLLAPFVGNRAVLFMNKMLDADFTLSIGRMHYDNLWRLTLSLLTDSMIILVPLIGASSIVGLIINYAQVGFLFSPKALAPKFSRLSPLQGFKRMFSTKSLVELAKSILKVVILGIIVYDEYTANLVSIPMMMSLALPDAVTKIVDTILTIGIKAGVALLILAVGDFIYQWWSFEKDLRMTKQEVKDEYKQMEGDPKIKGKIRQKQRQMAMMRMMQAVPDADVVITNPTHYAIALKYQEGRMTAPEVVAKGKDFLAKRIREIAAEHGVETVENKPVAQSLYFFCEVGDPIPENLYQAVAEILAVIFRARKTA